MPEKLKGKGLIVLGGWARVYLAIIVVVFVYATLAHDSSSKIYQFLPDVVSDLIIHIYNYGVNISVFGDNYFGFTYALWEGIASAIVIGILLLIGWLLVQWIIAGFKRQ
jgi:hypothetical protein